RSFLVAVAAGAVGTLLPGLYVKRRKSGRRKAFDSQLADTVMMMANALRGGFSLLQAMDLVSREAPSPTAEEFTRVIREVGLGLAPEDALEQMVQRTGSDALDIMVTAINIHHEGGGNLAQVLDTIGHTIRERVRIKGEIAALTA